MLFEDLDIDKAAKKFNCIIVLKKPVTVVCSPQKCVEISGGNPGLTKGGTGDAQAGLTVALLAKNNSLLAAYAASYVVKKAGDELYQKVGEFYNADDLVNKLPEVLARL
jgi:NAD(P)H-hydrate repair Nnr-like enzyme with NAD(P)H-hydrate dehydratase domain